ncbi:T9SS type A sorting domain-containing protein [Chryseobacterium chendengshani]|uniref:T9SS type A sorting domain-containing protein n=1 Tax=Chryseobacterium sp. LJ756 TaxID=2864113 RepID=UPI001C63CD38|nr:T9SS type A sorting domain-containing protein [Chryseobacterium sp. LJ756]MBW7674000.1 T9SS type A sorting domain-containing protein [Chryseobacterium sp. LJ756]
MKKILFLIFLLPLFSYCQYYIGKLPSYPSQDNHYLNNASKAIAKDGSIYIYAANSLTKINVNGAIDTSFGSNGVVTNIPPMTNVSESQTLIAVNDQNIFLYCNKKIAKYNINGVIDTTFGNAGFLTLSLGVWKMIIDNDSSLFVMLSNTYKINKILPNGGISNAFEINNVKDFYKTDLNQIYATYTDSSTNPNVITMSKYSLDGTKDMNFGNSGSISFTDNLILNEKNGEFYLKGNNQLTKYTASGIIDTNFGIAGTVNNVFPSVNKVVSDSNNKVLFFGGNQGYGSNLTAIFRLESTGILDNTFNNGNYLYSNSGTGMITDVLLLDDYTFICLTSTRVSLNSTVYGTAKYLRTQNVLGIVETENINSDIQIFPNPVSDVLLIKTKDKIKETKVYSIDGKLLISGDTNEIHVENLPLGNYILEVISNKNIYNKKFIKK